MYKKENGVTLILLMISVMILIIIAGVVVNSGIKGMREASIASLKTNLMQLEVKGKGDVEQANFELGTDEKTEEQKQEIKNKNLKGVKYNEQLPVQLKAKEEAYELSASDMEQFGLNELKDTASDYIMVYNIEDDTVDVIYKPGITIDNNKYYTLSSMEEAGV